MSLRGSVSTMAIEDVLEWGVRRKVTGVLTAEEMRAKLDSLVSAQ